VERIPLYYTFGNHMHWVDMEWLWGYHVLPGSVRDMLRFCREAGVKGNVNFDGIGYEKLAAEDPEALAELRGAVQSGLVEPVGCSYGQPYGLFHGGESNVRQRIYGVRAVMRLLGVRPRTFWEEEFDFFPQLPQMLAGVGFTGASLFFQWTWHTPEVPREEEPVVLWEGQDGARLPCATRNRLNLHQWPEDMDILLRQLSEEELSDKPRLILQWLELMPSPDWMCRSELLLPKMRELLGDERFEITPCTLGEFLDLQSGELPVRRYGMDDVWHGLSLGKNGDRMREWSKRCESELLRAEGISSMMGMFGRPYAQWDVYPTWELEEGWRELLSAQHHDNDECEGLCGHVGLASYRRSLDLAEHVARANWKYLEARVDAPEGAKVIYNPLGWARQARTSDPENPLKLVPAFGYVSLVEPNEKGSTSWRIEGQEAIYERGPVWMKVDLLSATVAFPSLLQGSTTGRGAGGGEAAKSSNESSSCQLFELLLGRERLEIGDGFEIVREGFRAPTA
jgi:alpha-mannosidase